LARWWTAVVAPCAWCAPEKGKDMTNMHTSEFLRGVDHAAAMDDRWLFIASLVVIGIFGLWVMRYFVKQHERLLDDHKASAAWSSPSVWPIATKKFKTNPRSPSGS
jgi:hypothetical protein